MHWQLLTAALVVAAPAPAEKKDEEKIRGTWAIVSHEFNGGTRPDDSAYKDTKVVIKGDTITITDGDDEGKWTFKLDPTTKPKEIDLTSEDKEKSYLGIYELTGDELKICAVKGRGGRPTEFASKPGAEQELIVLKRVTKKK
jgi:uncharacterized protein (TIGR03067 family)